MTESLKIYQNPYYHCVIAAIPMTVPSKRPEIKYDNNGTIISGKLSKGYMTFDKLINHIFQQKENKSWPYTDYLQVAIELRMLKRDFECKDIDNSVKTILDSFKGIIYNDDSQIISLSVDKLEADSPGFILGVRRTVLGKLEKLYPQILCFEEPDEYSNYCSEDSNCNDSCILIFD